MIGAPETFKAIEESLKKVNIKPEEAGIRMIPKQEVELETNEAISILRTVEALEDSDDVQNVYTNLRVTEEALAMLEEE